MSWRVPHTRGDGPELELTKKVTSPPKTSLNAMLVSGALERYDGAWAEGAAHRHALRMGVRATD